jgi:hypothetical protein
MVIIKVGKVTDSKREPRWAAVEDPMLLWYCSEI